MASPPAPAAPASASKLARLALRVAAGTLLFSVVLLSVQSGDARIAGMMLTFPALNGMSLMMTPRPEKRAMAAAMLPVIGLNGLIALSFITIDAAIGAGATMARWPALPWLMVAAGMAVWLAACVGLSRMSARAQWRALAVYGAASLVLIAGWWPGCQVTAAAAVPDPLTVLARNVWRIALFAATLGALLGLAEWGGTRHGWLGRLGAFPILPLFSLAIIAGAEGSIADRMTDLRAPILVGLLLAMTFAWVYAGVLERFARPAMPATPRRTALSLAALVCGWLAVAASMFAVTAAIDRVMACAM
jgi:hypothetical protein